MLQDEVPEVVDEHDDVLAEDDEAKNVNVEVNTEAKKPQVVHEIAGGRTDEELKAFYRGVHGKLAAHNPGTWRLVKADYKSKLKMADELANLKQDEVQQQLKKKKKQEKSSAAQQQQRNPDRRKRTKLEIKLDDDQDDKDDEKECAQKPMTAAAKASAAAVAAAVAEGSKRKTTMMTSVCGGEKTVLASLVITMLSQNTNDRNWSSAWANLQCAYNAEPSQLIDVLRSGGLAQRKGGLIQGLLNQLHEERNGELSLEHLRDLPTEEAKQELYKYKGVGPKTASCVLMFNMKRADFPVDTHVHRVSTRLGFVRGATAEQTYEFMNATMPDEIKRGMHVLLVRHGREICKARGPKCGECVLRDDCHYSQTLKEKKKELKLDDGEEEEEEKATTSKRRSRSTAERGGASKKGTKRANREEDDDGDQEYGEDREGTTLVRKAKSDGAANKRVAKRRRSAPASIIGDIEDSA